MPKKEELEKFLKEEIHPVFEALVTDLLTSVPRGDKLIPFCIQWLSNKQAQKTRQPLSHESAQTSDDDEMDQEAQQKFAEMMTTKRASKVIKTRSAVSAEVYGDYNKKQEFKPRVIPKSSQVKERIAARLMQSFMFASLDEKESSIVIDAMEEKNFQEGDTIISQGDDGDCLYVVDKGELECFKRLSGASEDKYLRSYVPGEAFGQLSLLYNAPRAATIVSKGDSVLFALDRQTFNGIVKDSAEKKRKIYSDILTKVELLKDMDPYQRNQISDVLKELKVGSGNFVINEGDIGDKFYIVYEGEFVAIKNNADGSKKTVMTYKEGDYFGELALLKDIPRQASVQAVSAGRLMYIERDAFKRMLGPVEKILERNSASYEKFSHT